MRYLVNDAIFTSLTDLMTSLEKLGVSGTEISPEIFNALSPELKNLIEAWDLGPQPVKHDESILSEIRDIISRLSSSRARDRRLALRKIGPEIVRSILAQYEEDLQYLAWVKARVDRSEAQKIILESMLESSIERDGYTLGFNQGRRKGYYEAFQNFRKAYQHFTEAKVDPPLPDIVLPEPADDSD